MVLCSLKSRSYFWKKCFHQRTWKKSAFANLWPRNLFACIQKVKLYQDQSVTQQVYITNNVCKAEKRTKRTSISLLHLVRFSAVQTLHCTKIQMQLQKTFCGFRLANACAQEENSHINSSPSHWSNQSLNLLNFTLL